MSVNIWQAPNTWIEQGGGITLTATEVLNSFTDTSMVNIDYNVDLDVTEAFSSFGDNSSIKLPANWNTKTPVTTSYSIKPIASTLWITKG